MRAVLPLLVGLVLLGCGPQRVRTGPPAEPEELASETTEVVIIGTFHGMHYTMSAYHPDALRHLIAITAPDVLALELRPDDLAQEGYGKAPADIKNIAIPWAKKHEVLIRAIDWWDEGSRAKHDAFYADLRKTEEGRAKIEALPDELGIHADACPQIEACPIAYIHSPEFADKDRGVRKAYTDAFGEGPGNLFWNTRAEKMNAALERVVDELPGRRIVVVTGAAHRGDFERALAKRDDVTLVPLSAVPGYGAPPPYTGVEGGADELKLMLLQLVQGRKANRTPDAVDTAFLAKLLEGAKVHTSLAVVATFAKAELAYLTKRYDEALTGFDEVARTATDDDTAFGAPLGPVAAMRAANMADLLAQRDDAVKRYRAAVQRHAKALGPRLTKLLEGYVDEPYQRPR